VASCFICLCCKMLLVLGSCYKIFLFLGLKKGLTSTFRSLKYWTSYWQVDFLRHGTHKPSDTGIFHGAWTISSLPFPVTQPTYPQNLIVVSPLNVPLSMSDIFALFANIHLKLKHISPTKNYFFQFREENYDKCIALTLNHFASITHRLMFN